MFGMAENLRAISRRIFRSCGAHLYRSLHPGTISGKPDKKSRPWNWGTLYL
jgi:hypothetical protein